MALTMLSYHIPLIVILVCYLIVFIKIRKLFKVRPGVKPESLLFPGVGHAMLVDDVSMALAAAVPPLQLWL